jgi:hypothetical protein
VIEARHLTKRHGNAVAAGGRWPYRAPAAPVPELPRAEVDAPRAENREDAVLLSGIDIRFDLILELSGLWADRVRSIGWA